MTATFVPEVEFICPFCKAYVGANSDGVMHAMPLCQTFEDLEPDEFLTIARAQIQRKEGTLPS